MWAVRRRISAALPVKSNFGAGSVKTDNACFRRPVRICGPITGTIWRCCAVCGRCGSYLVVEADGSVYPCDFFALDQWRMGRVGEQSLTELARSDRAQAFLDWGKTGPAECAACRWASLCGGGCKRDWYGEPPRNYYCAAFQSLLDYAMPRLVQMARAVY